MLSTDEQAAFQESIARVRQLAAYKLGQAQGADAAIAFTVHLHRGLDAVARQASATGPAPDCQAGCAHCCHLRVEATDPEIFRIAQHLRSLPPAVQAHMTNALRQHGAQVQAQAQGGAPRPACAFLADNRCSIYEVRPAACRKAHSLSVQQCASLAPQIPQNLRLLVDAEALMAGTAQAYRDRQLPANAHELNAAVLTALTDATAQERWFGGDAVF